MPIRDWMRNTRLTLLIKLRNRPLVAGENFGRILCFDLRARPGSELTVLCTGNSIPTILLKVEKAGKTIKSFLRQDCVVTAVVS